VANGTQLVDSDCATVAGGRTVELDAAARRAIVAGCAEPTKAK
jgi:hypothetical protein